ncbi:hypothetical protein GJ744_002728 [Endocarpon pusillum]|uniref:54S ribosomal protein L24 n=1 Tax=Endocarpon pusillum TaxID=364733 RepID=A0A8H7AVR0_9EURO|nr:hypothetical protein GJ744_002728 [Endocarpon pusillum]
MSQAFATARTALASLCSSCIHPQLKIIIPSRAFHAFHPWRPTTKISELSVKDAEHRKFAPCPPYPYGSRHTFKEADQGLYGGALVQSGNKISQGRNKGKTRRKWYPNVRLETIRSEALNKTMTIPITASCMRTIRKCGGLDQYLLGDKPARIKELGVFGWRLRWKVMSSAKMRAEFQQQRKKLGLPLNHPCFESFDEVWEKDQELKREVKEEQEKQWQELKERDNRFRQHVMSHWEDDYRKTKKPKIVVPPFDEAAFESL